MSCPTVLKMELSDDSTMGNLDTGIGHITSTESRRNLALAKSMARYKGRRDEARAVNIETEQVYTIRHPQRQIRPSSFHEPSLPAFRSDEQLPRRVIEPRQQVVPSTWTHDSVLDYDRGYMKWEGYDLQIERERDGGVRLHPQIFTQTWDECGLVVDGLLHRSSTKRSHMGKKCTSINKKNNSPNEEFLMSPLRRASEQVVPTQYTEVRRSSTRTSKHWQQPLVDLTTVLKVPKQWDMSTKGRGYQTPKGVPLIGFAGRLDDGRVITERVGRECRSRE